MTEFSQQYESLTCSTRLLEVRSPYHPDMYIHVGIFDAPLWWFSTRKQTFEHCNSLNFLEQGIVNGLGLQNKLIVNYWCELTYKEWINQLKRMRPVNEDGIIGHCCLGKISVSLWMCLLTKYAKLEVWLLRQMQWKNCKSNFHVS